MSNLNHGSIAKPKETISPYEQKVETDDTYVD